MRGRGWLSVLRKLAATLIFAFNTKYMIPEIQNKIVELQAQLEHLGKAHKDLEHDLAELRQQLQVDRPPQDGGVNHIQAQRDYGTKAIQRFMP